ncbi:MAG: hypothetical protein K9G67_12260 [Bacteroidales bacterium]|nr:hypothetical protein [Bacteroidales bacterium]MCF8343829.1 hypothetical protein [Bacteroidales bacterium]MCF8377122.1 hypothetical protein [Bacteroidales bacterium]MCF8401028.1 hypothetical protein [Bacteroidales bacterium]
MTLTTLIIAFVISSVVTSAALWIGAGLSAIVKDSYRRAIIAGVLVSLIMWFLPYLLDLYMPSGSTIGWIAGIIISFFIIKMGFVAHFSSAMFVWFFAVGAQIFVSLVMAFIWGVNFEFF